MREIKFRCWDKVAGLYLSNGNWTGINQDGNPWLSVEGEDVLGGSDRWVVEQYTGLKDKNGREIYEGDIVKATVRISTPYKGGTFRNIRGNVIYGPGGAFCIEEPEVFTSNDEGSEREFTVINPLFNVSSKAGVEVIGNIHENPELLGGED